MLKESRILKNEAIGLFKQIQTTAGGSQSDADLLKVKELITKALEIDERLGYSTEKLSPFSVNPWYAFDWQGNPEAYAAFKNANVQIAIQKMGIGEDPTLTEWDLTKHRMEFANPGVEMVGSVVFDWTNLADGLIELPFKGAKALIGKSDSLTQLLMHSPSAKVLKESGVLMDVYKGLSEAGRLDNLAPGEVDLAVQRAMLDILPDSRKYLLQQAARSKSLRLQSVAGDMSRSLAERSAGVDDFMNQIELAAELAETSITKDSEMAAALMGQMPSSFRIRQLKGADELAKIIPPSQWVKKATAVATNIQNVFTAKYFDDAVRAAKAAGEDITTAAAQAALKAEANVKALEHVIPKAIAQGFADAFRKEFINSTRVFGNSMILNDGVIALLVKNFPTLKTNALGKALVGIDNLYNGLMGAWYSAVLSLRPAWVVRNFQDNITRFVTVGGHWGNDLQEVLHVVGDNPPEGLIQSMSRLPESNPSSIGFRLQHGQFPKSFADFYKWQAKEVWKEGFKLSWDKNNIFGSLLRDAVDLIKNIGVNPFRVLSAGTSDWNNYVEYSFRLRLYATKLTENRNILRSLLDPELLANAPPEYRKLAAALLDKAGNNTVKLEEMIKLKDATLYSYLVPDGVEDLMGKSVLDRQHFLNPIKRKLEDYVLNIRKTANRAPNKQELSDFFTQINKEMDEFHAAAAAKKAEQMENEVFDMSSQTRDVPDSVFDDANASRMPDQEAIDLRGKIADGGVSEEDALAALKRNGIEVDKDSNAIDTLKKFVDNTRPKGAEVKTPPATPKKVTVTSMPTDSEIDEMIEAEFGKRAGGDRLVVGDHWSDEYRAAVKAKIDERAKSIDMFWEKVNTLPPEVGIQFSKINAELTEATYRTQQALMIRFPWVDAEPAERRVLYKQFETYYTAARRAQGNVSEQLSKMLDAGKPIDNFDWLTYYKEAGIGFSFNDAGNLSEVKFLIPDDFGNTPRPIKTQMWLDEFRRVLRSGKSGVSDKDALVNFTHITRQEAEQLLKFPKPPKAKVFTAAEVLTDPTIAKLWKRDAPIGKWDDPISFIDPNKTPLRGTKYAIVSVDNPNGEILSDAENLLRQEELKKILDERGLTYKLQDGSYGAPEKSFLIIGADMNDAIEFGTIAGKTQEAVITQDGMIYLAGDNQGKIMLPNWEDGIDFSPEKSDYFTEFLVGDQKIKVTLPYRVDGTATVMDLNDFTRPDYEEIVRQIARKYDPKQIGGTTGLSISKVLHDYLKEAFGNRISFKGVGIRNLKKVLEHMEFEGFIGDADNFTSLVVNAFNAKANKTVMKEVPALANDARVAMRAGFIEAGQTPEQVDLLVEMTDFYAKRWAERTGKTADEFWLYQWAGISNDDRVDLMPRLLYNEVGEPVWYSPLQNAIQTGLKDRTYPDGMAVLNRLKAIPGIKQEELEITGVVDWLMDITADDLKAGIWVGDMHGPDGASLVHELTPDVVLDFARQNELNMVDDLSIGAGNSYYDYTLKTGPEDTYFIHKFIVPDAPAKTGGHFSGNDVAWVRGNVVTVQTKNGPMNFLMIDEIQSDIHESARDVMKQIRWDLHKKYSDKVTEQWEDALDTALINLKNQHADEILNGTEAERHSVTQLLNEFDDGWRLANPRPVPPDISDPASKSWLMSQLDEDELALLNSGGYTENWYKYAQNKWERGAEELRKNWAEELKNPPHWDEFLQSAHWTTRSGKPLSLADVITRVKGGDTAFPAFDIKQYREYVLALTDRSDPKLMQFIDDLEAFRIGSTVDDSFLTNSRAVLLPKYPFSKNYTEMAAKRMIRKAVDDGLEGVSWTTGAQQVERYGNVQVKWKQIGTPEDPEWEIFTIYKHNGQDYDQSIGKIKSFEDIRNLQKAEISSNWAETLWKKIKSTDFESSTPPKYTISPPQGNYGDRYIVNGVTSKGDKIAQGFYTEGEAHQYITQLREAWTKKFDGSYFPMKEGMENAYDKELTDIFNKMGKKFNVQVEDVQFVTAHEELFSEAKVLAIPQEFEGGPNGELITRYIAYNPQNNYVLSADNTLVRSGSNFQYFHTKEQALEGAARFRKLRDEANRTTVHSIKFTDEMKAWAAGAKPLFNMDKQGVKRAAAGFDEFGRGVINNFIKQGMTPLDSVHELVHVYIPNIDAKDWDVLSPWLANLPEGKAVKVSGDEFLQMHRERWITKDITPVRQAIYDAAHEALDDGLLRTIAEQTLPVETPEVKTLFQKLAGEIKKWYNKWIKGTPREVEVSPEVRKVFAGWFDKNVGDIPEVIKMTPDHDAAWQTLIKAQDLEKWGPELNLTTPNAALKSMQDMIDRLTDPSDKSVMQQIFNNLKSQIDMIDHTIKKTNKIPTATPKKYVPVPTNVLPIEYQQWYTYMQDDLQRLARSRQALIKWRDFLIDAFENAGKGDETSQLFLHQSDDFWQKMGDWTRESAKTLQDMEDVAIHGGEFRGININGALNQTNDAMLDYTYYKRWENIMRMIYPFWMFPTRSTKFWAKTLIEHPKIASWYQKYMLMSQRTQMQEGLVTSQGRPLPSYTGYIKIPGTNIWFNPVAPMSVRYVLNPLMGFDTNSTYNASDETTANEISPMTTAFREMYSIGVDFGFSMSPMVLAIPAVRDAIGNDTIPVNTIAPILDLVPLAWRKNLMDKMHITQNSWMRDAIAAEVPWKDYLVEYAALKAANSMIQARQEDPDRQWAIANEYRNMLMDPNREENKLWLKYVKQVENGQLGQKWPAYFTGVYGKPWTTADAEFLELRHQLNLQRAMINNNVGADLFNLAPDAMQRAADRAESAYDTPDGQIYNLSQAIRFVVDEAGNEITDQADRRVALLTRFNKDILSEEYYSQTKRLREIRDSKLEKLALGSPNKLKDPINEEYYNGLDALNKNPLYEDIDDAPWSPVNKPAEGLMDHYRWKWFKALHSSKPQYDSSMESYAEFQQRLIAWESDLPHQADLLTKSFRDEIDSDITELFPYKVWGKFIKDVPGGELTERVLSQLQSETTTDGMSDFYKKFDSVAGALDTAWYEMYYAEYLAAVDGLSGDQRTKAENGFFAANKPPTPSDLTEHILADRVYSTLGWSYDQILKTATGLDALTVEERQTQGNTPAGNKVDEMWNVLQYADSGTEKSAWFDEFRKQGGDEDELTLFYGASSIFELPKNEERLNELLKIVKATNASMGLKAPTGPELDLRIQAKTEQALLTDMTTDRFGADIYKLSTYYGGLSYAEKAAFKKDFPEDYARLKGSWDLKDQFGTVYPVWKSFYDPDSTTSTSGGYSSGGSSSSSGGYSSGGSSSGGSSSEGLNVSFPSGSIDLNYKLRDDWLKTGMRGSLNVQQLISGYRFGKGGTAGLPHWPDEMMEALGGLMVAEFIKSLREQAPLSPAAIKYLAKMKISHPEWAQFLTEMEQMVPQQTA